MTYLTWFLQNLNMVVSKIDSYKLFGVVSLWYFIIGTAAIAIGVKAVMKTFSNGAANRVASMTTRRHK